MDPEKLALQIRDALKAEGSRGEPNPQLVDRLLVLTLNTASATARKVASGITDLRERSEARDYADTLDPFLR